MSISPVHKRAKKTYLYLISITFTLLLPEISAFAVNDWQTDNISGRYSDIHKPVDPVYINVVPYYIEKGSIPINIGENWRLDYILEAGKRYHIFLVGEWISNTTTPTTDYDILTYYPNGWQRWNTESAGLPEQVAFDENHHYFVPPETGEYQFKIYNDVRDSIGTDQALFMVIENIDLNKEYTRYLEGREENPITHEFEEVELTSWSYEFTTESNKIRILVDVPDYLNDPIERGELDMYEARLYAMAAPTQNVGHIVDGIGVPSGDLFDSWHGEFGGYNSSAQGDRNILAMASCEYPGADMEFIYDTPNDENSTGKITYFLTFIAEHGEGTIKFTVQTDFDSPDITILDPPMVGIANQETLFNIYAIDESEVKDVWIEYSIDNGTTPNNISLIKQDETWSGSIPAFETGSLVNYTVWSKDMYDNEGGVSSSFPVRTLLEYNVSISDRTISTGQELEIEGSVNLHSASFDAVFTNEDFSETIEFPVDSEGQFSFDYYPVYPGKWTLSLSYPGDELTLPGASEEIEFTKASVSITCNPYSNLVIGNQKAVISGTSSLKSTELVLSFIHQDVIYNRTTLTSEEGVYEYSFSPDRLGDWKVIAYFDGTSKELPAQSIQNTFTYESWTTHIYANVNPAQVKLEKPIIISGSFAPELPGYPINILFISPSSVVTSKTVYTSNDGTFTYTFNPDEEGTWDVKTSGGDGLIYAVAISYYSFDVIPLTVIDKASAFGFLLITPPYLYATLSLTVIGLSGVLYLKREKIIPYLPKSLAEKLTTKKKKKKKSGGGTSRYVRKK